MTQRIFKHSTTAARATGEELRANRTATQRYSGWRLTVIVAGLVVAISVIGLYFLKRQLTSARADVYSDLNAIAQLKTEEIANWRNERLSDGRFLVRAPFVAEDVAALLVDPGSTAARTRVFRWLDLVKSGDIYDSALLLDPAGNLRLAIPEANQVSGAAVREILAAAARSNDAAMTDLHRDGVNGPICMEVLAPVFAPDARPTAPGLAAGAHRGAPIAVIVLRLNPERFLFPLIQAWPMPSKTAETLLVRREGNEVVFLNELRHRHGTALALRRSVDDPHLPAAIAARGQSAVTEGVDYRGEPVLSAVLPVPDSPWMLIAKVDQAEVYAPIHAEAWRTGLILDLLVVSVVLSGAYLWRLRRAASLNRELALERERKILAERLAAITRHANDVILFMDADGRIIEANDRALATYGYTLEELRRLPPGGLRSSEAAGNRDEQFSGFALRDGTVFETVHRRRDGTTFPIEVSGRSVEIEGRQFRLGIYRDITERKARELEIERLNRLYRSLSQVNQAIVRHSGSRQGLLEAVCRELAEHGQFRLVWIGQLDERGLRANPVAWGGPDQGFLKGFAASTDERAETREPTGAAIREGRGVVSDNLKKDLVQDPWRERLQRYGFGSGAAYPLRLWGKVWGNVTVYAAETGFFRDKEVALLQEVASDISFAVEHGEIEAQRSQLETHNQHLAAIVESSEEAIISRTIDGTITSWNPAAEKIFGYAAQETMGALVQQFFVPPERERDTAEINERLHRGEPTLRMETVRRHKNGCAIQVDMTISPLRDREGRVVGAAAVVHDITKRKEAEAALRESEGRYRSLFENMMEGYAYCRMLFADGRPQDFIYLAVNAAFEKQTGLHDVIGKKITDLIPGIREADPELFERYGRVALSGRPERFETFVKALDMWFSIAVYSPAKEHFVAVFDVITERKQAEAALRASEAQLTNAAKIAHLGPWEYDVASDRFIFNDLFYEMLRTTAEREGGYTMSSARYAERFIHPDERAIMGAEFRRVLEMTDLHFSHQVERRIVYADGESGHMAVRYLAIKDEQGRIVRTYGVNQDITERKHAEESLRKSRERLSLALDAANDGLWDWNIPSGRAYFSPRYYTMLGFEPGEFPASFDSWQSHLHPDDRPSTLATIQGFLEGTGGSYAIEFRLRTKPGDWCWILSRGKVVEHDAAGRAVRIVGTHTDITERKRAESDLRLFRALIERSNDAIEVVDPATMRFVDVNQSACRNLGYTRDEMLALTVSDVSREFAHASSKGIDAQLKKTGYMTIEGVHRRKDGSTYSVEVSLSLITLDREYIVSIVRDVTERNRVYEQLRELSRAVEQSPVTVMITNNAGDIEYVNPKFTELTGYTLDEVRGRNPRFLQSGLTPAAVYADLWATITTGREWRGEFQNRKKNGELFWESAVISPLRDAAGQVTRFVGAKLDITQQKLADRQLREQAALLDQANDAIYVRNLDGTIRYWNEGAARLYGWTAAEAIGRKLAELDLSDAAQDEEFDWKSQRAADWAGERQHTARNGTQLTVFSRLTLTRDPQGQPVTIMAFNTDITEKKQIETRFLQAQRLDSLGALASGLAHDLNNVLGSVLMSTELLKDRLANESERKMVATMEASAKRGAGIVRQVLTFARGIKGERVPVQVGHLLREMADIATETFPRGIAIRMDAPKDLWCVLGDATQLHQILMNLCINARDAMPHGGILSLTAENFLVDEAFAAMTPGANPGSYICVKVTDTGTGIAPELREKIFEPFFTTKKEGKGTGLGLSTVLGIAKSHGGFLQFNSSPGHGTCFEVYFPVMPSTEMPPERTKGTEPHRGEGQTVLVVDDEPAIRAVAAQVLEHHGYRPVCATDGFEAIAVYVQQAGSIAAVVTDMVMPGMEGSTLVQTLRHISPQLPIIGITGLASRGGLEAFEAMGLQAVLIKPFTAEKLLRALHDALHPSPSEK